MTNYPAESFQDHCNELREKAMLRKQFREAGDEMIYYDRTFFLCQVSVWLDEMGYEFTVKRHNREVLR